MLNRPRFVIFMFEAMLLTGFVQSILSSIMPIIGEQQSLSPSQISWHFSAFAFGRLMSGFSLLHVAPYFKLEFHLKILLMLVCVFLIVFYISTSMVLNILLSCLIGIAVGINQAVIQMQFARVIEADRSAVIAEGYLVASIGTFLCPIFVSSILKINLPWILALLPIFAIILALMPRERSELLPFKKKEAGGKSDKLNVPVFFTLIMLGNAAEWSVGLWGAPFLQERLGLTSSEAIGFISLYFIGVIFGRLANARMLRSLSLYRTTLFWIVLGIVSLIFLLLYANYIALFIAGAAFGCLYPNNIAIAMKIDDNAHLAISTAAAKASGFALLTFPLLIGYIGDFKGVSFALSLVLVLPIIIFALTVSLRHKI